MTLARAVAEVGGMKFFRPVAALAALFFLPACASIVAGTHKTVRVTSQPSGALLKLDGDTRAITPGELHPSTRTDHTVTIELAGYEPYEVKLVRKHSDWEWGNVATGLAPGIAFDGATGAVYRFDPSVIHAKLRPLRAGR